MSNTDLIQDVLNDMEEANEQSYITDYKADVDAALKKHEEGYSQRWIDRLPRNMGVGLFRAGLNTIEAADEAAAEMGGIKELTQIAGKEGPPLRSMYPGLFEAAHNFADRMEKDSSEADDATQLMTGFTLPFLGYMKMFSAAIQTGKLAKGAQLLAADFVTAGTVFEPDEHRFADLVSTGRQMENKFGAALDYLSPDGSVLNAYIDYFTSREGDTRMEGRFKNAVDSNIAFAAIGPFFKLAGVSLRGAKNAITNKMKIGFDDFVAPDMPKVTETAKAAGEFKSFPTTDADAIVKATKEQGGYSVKMDTGEIPKTGHMVGMYPNKNSKTMVLGENPTAEDFNKFIKANKAELSEPDVYIGTWVEDGKVYIDLSKRIGSETEAREFAEKSGQLAIHRLDDHVDLSITPRKPKPKAGVAIVGAGAAAAAGVEASNRSRK